MELMYRKNTVILYMTHISSGWLANDSLRLLNGDHWFRTFWLFSFYRNVCKYWISRSRFLGLLDLFLRAEGTLAIFNGVQDLEPSKKRN